MAFLVHRAERADLLAEGLADLLRTPPSDPFAREWVIVPARGVERWLSQRLSHRLGHAPGREDGVCAGVDFRSPGSLIAEILGTADADPWAPEALVWPILSIIDASAGQPWCAALSRHLGYRDGDLTPEDELRRGRRYSVARRLARLFASYAVQRPGLLSAWEDGQDSDGAGTVLPDDLLWQAELWRRVVRAVGDGSPVARHQQACADLVASPERFGLPERLHFFGHTRIPVSEVALLEAIGAHHDVHLWLPHPSDALWQKLDGGPGVLARSTDVRHLAVGHPLTTSLGRDLRELQGLIGHWPSTALPSAERPDTMLGRLQSDLVADAVPAEPRPATADGSVSVHACHGPSRQVEVLREVLLGLLADDPTLEPRDVLVMCPDIETYAPLISAAFGLGDVLRTSGHPGQHLRVHMADRALTQTNPLLAVTVKLLDIAGGRAEASEILDLMSLPPVRRQFSFADADLERIAGWVEAVGVKWAFDASGRAEVGLDGYVQNTWRFGLDRILTGVAVSEEAGRSFGSTLPLDDVSSSDIDRVGRFAEFLDRLQRVTDALRGAHPVEHWVSTLEEGVAALTDVPWGDEWQLGQVQRELGEVRVAAEDGTELRLSDVRALLDERFTGRPTRANFRTGTLTVCTLTPMRSVPHRVIALLGLDDGVFPRAGAVDGDDVLARGPLTGERDVRSEERQLLLDAVLAAREHLVITYTGANETTGQPRPPSVPLQELLDTLDRTFVGGAGLVRRRHPLQAFDEKNLAGGTPFSFDAQALAGAHATLGEPRQRERLGSLQLPPPTGDIDLGDLVAYFKAPGKQFLRSRLGLALPDDSDPPSDAIPVEVNGLEEWAVGDRLLRQMAAGSTLDDAVQQEWRRGLLPPGRLGWRIIQGIGKEVGPLADLLESVTQGERSRSVDVDVTVNGRRVVGAVPDVYGSTALTYSYSRLGPKQELEAWINLLALTCSNRGTWSATAVGRGSKGRPPVRVTFPRADDAVARLGQLIDLYDRGMSEPLPLPLKTAYAYASRRAKGSPQAASAEASKKWLSGRWDGENAEPAHVILYGEGAGLAVLLGPPRPGEEYDGAVTRLEALSSRLWRPIIQARGQ